MTTVYVESGESTMLSEGRSLYVYTKKPDNIFDVRMRLLPTRYYLPSSKKWEVPLGSMGLLKKTFSRVVVVGDGLVDSKFASIDEYIDHLSKLSIPPELNFEPKTKMDPHQVEWFLEMLKRNRVILGDPMGLGKTKEYLDVTEFRRLSRDYRKTLFICKSKHKENMAKEIRIHCCKECDQPTLASCRSCEDCPLYIVVEGKEAKRIQLLRDFYYDDKAYYLIISYEMAAHHAKHLKSLGRTVGFDAVIMDEFNKIKNWGSQRKRQDGKPHITIQITKLVEVLNPELLILGSGTPMTKNPADLYAPLRLLGVEKRSHNQYVRHFCEVDGWGRPVGAKNVDELRELLSSVMIRRPKELLRLPEKRINYIPLVMEPAQRRLYDAAKNKIKSELVGTKVYGASKLALLTRLRQITTAPILVDSDVVGIKELVLEELLEEIRDSGEKAVVFSIYAQFTRYLRDKFQKFNPAYIDGTLNSRKAQEQVDKLEEDPNVSMIIASLFAGNESYTMTAARHAIFTDMSWTVTDNQQAEDRIHRRGQTESVSINYLYCKDSIDERVLDILEEDASLIYEVVEGSERRLSKEVFEHLLS